MASVNKYRIKLFLVDVNTKDYDVNMCILKKDVTSIAEASKCISEELNHHGLTVVSSNVEYADGICTLQVSDNNQKWVLDVCLTILEDETNSALGLMVAPILPSGVK